MAVQNVALILMLVATILGAVASVLLVLFKRPGVKLFKSRVSTLAILRDPRIYVREPYARAVQALGMAALALGAATIVSLMVWQLLR